MRICKYNETYFVSITQNKTLSTPKTEKIFRDQINIMVNLQSK